MLKHDRESIIIMFVYCAEYERVESARSLSGARASEREMKWRDIFSLSASSIHSEEKTYLKHAMRFIIICAQIENVKNAPLQRDFL